MSCRAGVLIYSPFMSIWWGSQGKVDELFGKAWDSEENKRSQFGLVFRNQKWNDSFWDQKCRSIKDSCQQWNLFMPTQFRKHFYLYFGLVSHMKYILLWIVSAWWITCRGLRNHLERSFHVHGLIQRLVYEEERLMKGRACYVLLCNER